MKKKTVCLGGGGHAKVLIEIAHRGRNLEVVAITERDISKHGRSLFGIPIVGEDDRLPELLKKGIRAAIIGVGGVQVSPVRRKLFAEAERLGFEMANVIDPNAIVSKEVRLGKGVTIFAGVIVNAGAVLGHNVVLYSGAIVEHDVTLEDHVQISPGAILAGGVRVGEGSFLGAGCCLLQGIHVGRNATVGAGAVVLEDVPDGITVVGIPARPTVSVTVGG